MSGGERLSFFEARRNSPSVGQLPSSEHLAPYFGIASSATGT